MKEEREYPKRTPQRQPTPSQSPNHSLNGKQKERDRGSLTDWTGKDILLILSVFTKTLHLCRICVDCIQLQTGRGEMDGTVQTHTTQKSCNSKQLADGHFEKST